MLLPIDFNKSTDMVEVVEVDEYFHATNRRWMHKAELDGLLDTIDSTVERAIFGIECDYLEENYEKLKVGTGETKSRVLCLTGNPSTLALDTEVHLYTGETFRLKDDLSVLGDINTGTIGRLDMFATDLGRLISYDDLVEVNESEDTGTDEQALEFDYFIWVDSETNYPIPMVVYKKRHRLLRVTGLGPKDNSLRFGLKNSTYKDFFMLGDMNWVELRTNYLNQEKFIYPLLDKSKLSHLLQVLANISPKWIAPFYLAYNRWYKGSTPRRFNFASGVYWDSVGSDEESEDYISALALFGANTKSTRVIHNETLYGVWQNTEVMIDSLRGIGTPIGEYVEGPVWYAFLDLSKLYLETNSLFLCTRELFYYINGLKGLKPDCIKLDYASRAGVYFAPSENIDSYIEFLSAILDKQFPLVVLINHEEWCQAGLRNKLSELLSMINHKVLNKPGMDRKDNLRNKVQFIKQKLLPQGEVWSTEIEVIATVSFSTLYDIYVDGRVDGVEPLLNTIYEDLVLGNLKFTGLLDEKIFRNEYQVLAKKDMEIIGNVNIPVNSYTLDNLMITLDNTLSTPVSLMCSIKKYLSIVATNEAVQSGKLYKELEKLKVWGEENIYDPYRKEHLYVMHRAIKDLGDSNIMIVEEVVPTALKDEFYKRIQEFRKNTGLMQ